MIRSFGMIPLPGSVPGGPNNFFCCVLRTDKPETPHAQILTGLSKRRPGPGFRIATGRMRGDGDRADVALPDWFDAIKATSSSWPRLDKLCLRRCRLKFGKLIVLPLVGLGLEHSQALA